MTFCAMILPVLLIRAFFTSPLAPSPSDASTSMSLACSEAGGMLDSSSNELLERMNGTEEGS